MLKSQETITKAIVARIAETLEISMDEVDTSKTWDDLEAYSIDVVHIVAMLARDLEILVPRESFEDLRTVDEFIAVFVEHQGKP